MVARNAPELTNAARSLSSGVVGSALKVLIRRGPWMSDAVTAVIAAPESATVAIRPSDEPAAVAQEICADEVQDDVKRPDVLGGGARAVKHVVGAQRAKLGCVLVAGQCGDVGAH